ncbi:DEAD/DEAH box helicase, partial [Desulfosarcina sp.]|nr:DEAD/DEAH box helicase [Desulfosarcina sp.]
IECSHKTLLLRKLRNWDNDFDPFDMVIFDEAHYMRNPGSSTFHLGESLAARAGSVLCVSATPVNNSNIDLHTLLRLIDVDFFETRAMFDELLNANRPAVQASNALARTPPDLDLLESAVSGMAESAFISKSPLFKQFIDKLKNININDLASLAKLQDLSEKLNLLGSYVNRTRRVQVKENRPVRVPKVLTVEYSPEEMLLYDTILSLIRRKCQLDKRPFHIFQLMGVQLRAASCLPVIAQEIKDEKFGNTDKLFDEGFYYGIEDDFIEPKIDVPLAQIPVGSLLNYNFELYDSKYKCLKNLLDDLPDNEKIIIFAYYRPTLSYLKRRLLSDEFTVTIIHGGIPTEQRMEELDRFEDKRGPMILLSSEVGSEGIDLQFCRVMVNYDLPWNPMRVEQRIGRIDRVGQQAKKLSIVNFKVRDTIEERLYDRLHSKLEKFANSLGDLEAIIGQEVKKMTVELLSKKLTSQEEAMVMELSEKVIEDRLIKMQALEESGDALIAFSDYVQQKIENDKYKGRYILPEELEDYLIDFFEREFQGCEVIQNTPVNGCLSINLTYEAHKALISFIGDNRTLSTRTFRQSKFNITFRRDVMKRLSKSQLKTVSFINHLSSLMRWITEVNKKREHNFYNVSALSMTHPKFATGNYCYRIERWKLVGLSKKEMLAYGIKHLENGSSYIGDEAENIFQSLLRNGKDWDYVDCDSDKLCQIHNELENELSEMFALAVEDFEAENTTNHQIKIQRVSAHFDRRISNDKIRLRSLRAAERDPHMIHMTEKRIENITNNKLLRIKELNNKATTDIETSEIAAGLFRII